MDKRNNMDPRDIPVNPASVGHRRNHPGDEPEAQYWDAAEHGSPLFYLTIRAPLPGEDSDLWQLGFAQGQSPQYREVHRPLGPVEKAFMDRDNADAIMGAVHAAVRKALRWEHETRTGLRKATQEARIASGKASRYEYDAEVARENTGGPF